MLPSRRFKRYSTVVHAVVCARIFLRTMAHAAQVPGVLPSSRWGCFVPCYDLSFGAASSNDWPVAGYECLAPFHHFKTTLKGRPVFRALGDGGLRDNATAGRRSPSPFGRCCCSHFLASVAPESSAREISCLQTSSSEFVSQGTSPKTLCTSSTTLVHVRAFPKKVVPT